MTFTFACPECRQLLQAPQGAAARWGQCPSCAIAFLIPELAETLSPMPLAGRMAIGSEGTLADGWRTVRAGLLVYRLGMLASFLGVPGALLLLAVTGLPGLALDHESFLGLLNLAAALALFAALTLMVLGQFLCCAAPRKTGVRTAASAALTFGLLTILGVGSLVLLALAKRAEPWRPRQQVFDREEIGYWMFLLLAASAILGAIAQLLFAAFLKRTAHYFGAERLERSTSSFLRSCMIVAAGTVVGMAFLTVVNAPGSHLDIAQRSSLVWVCTGAFGLVGFGLSIWLFDLTGRTSRSIVAWKKN